MDHLISYVAHLMIGYGIRRTLWHVPFGLVLLLALAAAWWVVRRSARRPSSRGYRRYRP